MKVESFFLTVCLTILIAGSAQAVPYTEANTNTNGGLTSDSGNKPYSQAIYVDSDETKYSGIAEVENDSLKCLSNIELGSNYWNEINGSANSLARTTIQLQVLSNGTVSFDWSLTGELRIVIVNPVWGYVTPLDASYSVSIIDSVSSDSVSFSDVLAVDEADPVGSYIVPVDLLDKYDFGGGTFAAASIIDVTLELQTDAAGTYGYYSTGTIISSDFSNSLSIGNLDNLVIIPEPASIILLLLGGIGLGQLRRR